jgi:NAD(P)-dependent dehydrogenase (short-subunit alcohol dehydrogenase family)
MPVIAIFGAGPALGLSTAQLFAAKGCQVALVARDPAKLARLEAELGRNGAGPHGAGPHGAGPHGAGPHGAGPAGSGTVASFTADLGDRAAVERAVAAVEDRFGLPDVVLYSPGDVSRLPVPAPSLTADELQTWLPLHLLSPVTLIQAVLPGMLERGSGSLLFALGNTARHPDAMLASVNTPQAGLLNYLHGLSAAVAPCGIYVGALLIGALIERSAAAQLFDSGHFRTVEPGALPRVEPADLAERLWEMAAAREAVEHEVS